MTASGDLYGGFAFEVEEIGNDETVTQRISRGPGAPPDIDAPRTKDQGKVSVQRGRKSPSEMFHIVRKGGTCSPDDGARYAVVGDLRRAGFEVTHSPTNRSKDHASVTYPADWDEAVALLFKSCMKEHLWNEGEA